MIGSSASSTRNPCGAGANGCTSILRALTSSRVLGLSLCYFVAEIGLYGVILGVPQIFAHAGVSVDNIGNVVAIPYAIAAIGILWWCHHSDRMKERVWHIAAASAVGCLGLAASAWLGNFPVLSVAAISMGAAGRLAILPIFWTLPAALLNGAAQRRGGRRCHRIDQCLGNVGGFAGPFMIGWIKNATGSYRWGLLAVAGSVLSTGIIAVLLGHDASVRARPRCRDSGS